MLVQLCKIAGCSVVAVVGASHKVAYVKSLGADVVIDKATAKDLWAEATAAAPGGYHAVFDANGVSTLQKSFASLAQTGASHT